MRRYSVTYLTPSGELDDFQKIAPALPVFEEAFSAFARGTMFETDQGPVPIEDLLPGDRLRMANGSHRTLRWKGSCILVPNTPQTASEMDHLIRVSSEAFGFARPRMDCVFGPSARLYHSNSSVRALTGHDGAFVPLKDFIDGVNTVQVRPATPVEVFHLAFVEQERLVASGIEVESYHPGAPHRFPLRGEMLDLFLSMFPHIDSLLDLTPPKLPRLRLQDLDYSGAA